MISVHYRNMIKLCSHDEKIKFVMKVNDQKNICLGIPRINDYNIL